MTPLLNSQHAAMIIVKLLDYLIAEEMHVQKQSNLPRIQKANPKEAKKQITGKGEHSKMDAAKEKDINEV